MNPEEANQLRRDLDDAVAEVVTETMNGRPHAPRPLSWSMGNRLGREGWGTELTGQAGSGDYAEHEVPGLVQEWADFLGLRSADDPVAGSTEVKGRFPLGRVSVWGVSDRAVWEAETARFQGPLTSTSGERHTQVDAPLAARRAFDSAAITADADTNGNDVDADGDQDGDER